MHRTALAAIVGLMLAGCSSQTPGTAATVASSVSASAPSSASSTAPTVSPTSLSTATSSSTSRTTSTSTTTTTTTTTLPPPVVMQPEVHTGSGDDIVTLTSTGVRILAFDCSGCSRNVTVKTNGDEGLIVNEIGKYSGRHLIDIFKDSNTTEVEISARGKWTLTLTDAFTTASFVTGKVAYGAGDDVLYFIDSGTKAKVQHSGESNFVVIGYGGTRSELAVNEIGDYSGTVHLTTPGLVQVEAAPGTAWNIDIS